MPDTSRRFNNLAVFSMRFCSTRRSFVNILYSSIKIIVLHPSQVADMRSMVSQPASGFKTLLNSIIMILCSTWQTPG